MGFFQKFPYTDDHQLNLDWVLRMLRGLHGGSTGQVLKKRSNKEYDWAWGDDENTSDYNDLSNKPQINGVTLSGNKTTAQLGISFPVDNSLSAVSTNPVENRVITGAVNDITDKLDAVTFFSANLLPITAKTTTIYSVTRQYSNGILISSGTSNNSGGRNSPYSPDFTLPAGTYTLSKRMISGPKRVMYLVWRDDMTYETFPSSDSSLTFTITAERTGFLSLGYSNNADNNFAVMMQLESGETATDWHAPSEKTAIDVIARQDLTHIKVMSYNVGCYNYGTSVDFSAAEQADITEIYRKFFNDQGCDIAGLQEAKTNFSAGNPVNPQIYNYLYPSQIDSINTSSIKSRYSFKEAGTFDISTDTTDPRHCAYAVADIAGHEVYLLTVHLSPYSAAYRADNYAEILDILAQHEYFIMFGDFNAGSDSTEYNPLLTAGYKIANCSYLGDLNTMGAYIGLTPGQYNDNICVSPNIIISGVQVLEDLYTDLKSDHLPIIADLIFNSI